MSSTERAPLREPPAGHRIRGKQHVQYRLACGKIVHLTMLQRLFVAEYMIDFNVNAAAIRAGYAPTTGKGKNNSPLTRPAVREAIEAELEHRSKRIGVTADRVIAEYAKIAFGDVRRVIEWDADGMRLRPSDEINPDDSAAVSEISINGDQIRVRAHDKVRALDSLAKHLGMFQAHNKREVTVTLEQLIVQSQQRAGVLTDQSKAEAPLAIAETAIKHEFDRRYGSGNPVIDAIFDTDEAEDE